MTQGALDTFEIGVAGEPIPGESSSGDGHVAVSGTEESLLAVIDGLGHGQPAREAAEVAARTLAENNGVDLAELVRLCHRSLRRTRGVVMTLARVDGRRNTITWLGVGNVGARLFRADSRMPNGRTAETALTLGGVVGHDLPALRASTLEIRPGDTLLFATDGIDPQVAPHMSEHVPLQTQAEQLLAEFGLRTDDALVLLARYRGG
jgi:negative regulator of sigma-B (phosphoserine phosphatase)